MKELTEIHGEFMAVLEAGKDSIKQLEATASKAAELNAQVEELLKRSGHNLDLLEKALVDNAEAELKLEARINGLLNGAKHDLDKLTRKLTRVLERSDKNLDRLEEGLSKQADALSVKAAAKLQTWGDEFTAFLAMRREKADALQADLTAILEGIDLSPIASAAAALEFSKGELDNVLAQGRAKIGAAVDDAIATADGMVNKVNFAMSQAGKAEKSESTEETTSEPTDKKTSPTRTLERRTQDQPQG